MARGLVSGRAVFGWAWPVLGLAAAASVVVAGRLSHLPPRPIWITSQWLMAFGVALPALHASLATVIVSAVAVGGSFVVLTMAALQGGRRVGDASATRLMAAMTAAFAIGQLIGPLTISASAHGADALRVPSLVGAALLALSALVLPLRVPRVRQ